MRFSKNLSIFKKVKRNKYTKIIYLLLLILLSPSCESTENIKEVRISEQEAEKAISLLYADSIALSKENFIIHSDDVLPLFSPALDDYGMDIVRYDELLNNAADELASLLTEASLPVFDYLSSYQYQVASATNSLIEANLFMQNRNALIDAITPMIRENIENGKDDFLSVYDAILLECEILRKNYLNLENVGVKDNLRPIEDFDWDEVALFCSSMVYHSLQQSEEELRNRPLSQQSNMLYTYFWEEI